MLLALCGAACAGAALPPTPVEQDERYRERQVLDPSRDEWADLPTVTGAPAEELERARSLLATRRPAEALRILKPWVEKNLGHERHVEGVYLLGEAYFETGDFYKAYENYETVVDNSSGELFYKALRREMDVARAFLAGQKRIFWRVFRIPAYDDGLTILSRVWERVPGTRIGEEALKLRADYFYADGQMDLAQDEYQHLAKEYPSGRWVRLASLRSAEAAANVFAGVRFDDRPLIDADERYRDYARTFPDTAARDGIPERLETIRTQRAAKDYDIARWYERTRQIDSAAYYYRLVLKDWPNTPSAIDAAQRLRALGLDESTERDAGAGS